MKALSMQLRFISGWDVLEIVLVATLLVSFVADLHV